MVITLTLINYQTGLSNTQYDTLSYDIMSI